MAKKKVITTTVVEEIVDDKPTASRILVVLDRSGSMQSCLQEAIGGFNKFLAEQKALPGECQFSLMLFDNLIEYVVVDTPIKNVSPLNETTFVPRGFTALYDAVGTMIDRYKLDNKPGVKTILVILTDGQENASKMYNHTSVSQLIKKVEGEYGWETIFLGSGFNVYDVAKNLNIKTTNTMQFDTGIFGQTTASYSSASLNATAYRTGTSAIDMSAIKLDKPHLIDQTGNVNTDALKLGQPDPAKWTTSNS